MRICFVSCELSGFRGGGIGTYVAEAGRALTAAGHEVWLITPDPGEERRQALLAHAGFARVVLLDDRGPALETPSDTRAHAMRVEDALHACGVTFDYVEFPDYLAEGFVAIRAHRLLGGLGDAVVAVTLHSPTHEILEWNRQLHLAGADARERCVLEEDAIRGAEVLLSPSTRLLEMVRERLALPPGSGRIVRYPMTLPAEPPPPPPARSSLAELRFLYFGRIEPRKGVDHLIEAFRQLPDLRLELVGRDEAYSPVATSFREWLSTDLPPNVEFVSALPRQEMLARLRQADVCILPSPWENWPNTCIEAMAEARVVIGGRHGGMGEMIEHGRSGFVVDGADPEDIVRVIRDELLAALPRLPEIGRAAAVRIRELSDPQRYVTAVEQIVSDAKTARAAARECPPGASSATIAIELRDEDAAALREGVAAALDHDGARHRVVVVDASARRGDAAGALEGLEGADRLTVVDAPRSRTRHPRDVAVERADGTCVVFLRARDRLRDGALSTVLGIFDRHPQVDGVVPLAAVHGPRGVRVRATAPFDPGLALARGALGDVPPILRLAALRRDDLCFDPVLEGLVDRGFSMDCQRLGLRVEHLPRVLVDLHEPRRDPRTPGDWQRQRALLGLLVDRHLPDAEPGEHRALVALLTRTWGAGAFTSELGELCHRTDAALGGRLPRLAAALRKLAARLLRAHGRVKDRRAGRHAGQH